MSEVVLGCDDNGVDDAGCIDTVAKILEGGGHTVEKLGIAPGPFADYSYGNTGNPKGKIGVYLMADSLVSVADLAFGGTGFKYAYFGIRGDLGLPRMSTQEDFNNNPIGRDADCTEICDKLAGLSYAQMNEKTKDKCQCVFGANPEELGRNILSAMGGGTGDAGTQEGQNASSDNVKTCVQNLLKHWDGDVECFIRGKNVYINRVRDPQESYSTALIEGVNVFNDSVAVTDINPNTPNHLVVEWTGGTIEFTNEKLMARFGEKLKTLTAVRKVVEYYEDTSSDSDASDGTGTADDGTGEDGTGTADGDNNTTGEENSNMRNIDGMNMYYPEP